MGLYEVGVDATVKLPPETKKTLRETNLAIASASHDIKAGLIALGAGIAVAAFFSRRKGR